jgi:hypothetical protein
MLQGKRSFLELLPSGEFFIRNTHPPITLTLAVRGVKTRTIVILPGITLSWTRNPQEEWLFLWELPAHGGGIHRRNGYSAGNYQFIDEESTRGTGFRQELRAH